MRSTRNEMAKDDALLHHRLDDVLRRHDQRYYTEPLLWFRGRQTEDDDDADDSQSAGKSLALALARSTKSPWWLKPAGLVDLTKPATLTELAWPRSLLDLRVGLDVGCDRGHRCAPGFGPWLVWTTVWIDFGVVVAALPPAERVAQVRRWMVAGIRVAERQVPPRLRPLHWSIHNSSAHEGVMFANVEDPDQCPHCQAHPTWRTLPFYTSLFVASHAGPARRSTCLRSTSFIGVSMAEFLHAFPDAAIPCSGSDSPEPLTALKSHDRSAWDTKEPVTARKCHDLAGRLGDMQHVTRETAAVCWSPGRTFGRDDDGGGDTYDAAGEAADETRPILPAQQWQPISLGAQILGCWQTCRSRLSSCLRAGRRPWWRCCSHSRSADSK